VTDGNEFSTATTKVTIQEATSDIEALRDKTTTLAPQSLRDVAVALPIPLVPPQTSALLPPRSIIQPH
jgi:hypothetical protein